MSNEHLSPEAYDTKLDEIVDTQNVSYDKARLIIEAGADDSSTFDAVGEIDIAGIPLTPERLAAREKAHKENIEMHHLQTDEQRAWTPTPEQKAASDASIKQARAAAELSRITLGRKF